MTQNAIETYHNARLAARSAVDFILADVDFLEATNGFDADKLQLLRNSTVHEALLAAEAHKQAERRRKELGDHRIQSQTYAQTTHHQPAPSD